MTDALASLNIVLIATINESMEKIEQKTYLKNFDGKNDPVLQEHTEATSHLSRRRFLQLMGASVALTTVSCRRPVQKIYPYVKMPENLKPGVEQYYASTFSLNNHAYGILVKTKEGRPLKIEGNPEHPLSLGALEKFAQASIYELYDPNRKRKPTISKNISHWDAWLEQTKSILEKAKKENKAVRILTESTTSPTLRKLLKQFESTFPNAKWIQYEPFSQENIRASYQAAFGRSETPKLHIDQAKILISLNADFLGGNPGSLTHIRNWSKNRKVESVKSSMSRLYAIETYFTNTGAKADHRLSLRPSQILLFSLQLAKALMYNAHINGDTQLKALLKSIPEPQNPRHKEFILAMAEDLAKNPKKSLILVGDQESKELHIVGHLLNHLVQSYGSTIDTRVSTPSFENGPKNLEPLLFELKSQKVDTLITLGGNPIYTLGQPFSDYFQKVPNTIRLSLYNDETSLASTYAAPLSHALESWGDAESEDGVQSLIQPTLHHLHDTKGAGEVLVKWLGQTSWLDEIKKRWKEGVYSKANTLDSFTRFWQASLHNGVVHTSLPKEKSFQFQTSALKSVEIHSKTPKFELQLHPSYTVYDGRFANNGWLQELPDPVTTITWDNAACMSSKTAKKLGVKQGNRIRIEANRQFVTLPIFIQPGLAEDVITLEVGYGRTSGGTILKNIGQNVFAFGSSFSYFEANVTKGKGKHKFAITQGHDDMLGRPIVLEASLEEYQKHPDFAKHAVHHPPLKNLDKEFEYNGHHWGMAIDLNSCVGCNGCVTACDIENNVPIVGKKEVLKSREMHWLRIDRYYEGDRENPKTVHQPMLCQQCDNAPCENVCPVKATTHTEEGLNAMTYNRCVGTRYCSNNCPYKVRRFNFFNYNLDIESPQNLSKNPDVTIRMRGIMEKCTFCVQRINHGKIEAKL